MEYVYVHGLRYGKAQIQQGKVVLLLPFSQKNNETFLLKMQELGRRLQKKLDAQHKNQIFSSEGVLLFGERVPFDLLPAIQDVDGRADFFRLELLHYASPLLQQLATQLGFTDIPLRIGLVKSKRGSCTHDNRIMLNQQLVHLPTRLIQYVVVHEACHLIEKNHAPAFWALVAWFLPQYKLLRKELRNQIFLDELA